ncbi:MAG TPA: hypothetical protein VEJ23_04970 [Solirubrobacteraceae bacterium]|nr:hypothetical protein [Solirubrobacteraceae bacterium]
MHAQEPPQSKPIVAAPVKAMAVGAPGLHGDRGDARGAGELGVR